MTSAIWIIAVAAFLFCAAISTLAIVVAGIRSDDRAKNLTSPPRTRTEQVTRRLLGVGVRTAEASHAAATPSGTKSSPVFPESDLP
jgi:hypothetical protein